MIDTPSILLNEILCVHSNKKGTKNGFLVYDNKCLSFWKYKPLGNRRYPLLIYLVVAIVRLFLKEKLVHAIANEDIQSISLEDGKDHINTSSKGGKFLGAIANTLNVKTKATDKLMVTLKNGETYTFTYVLARGDNSTFHQLVDQIDSNESLNAISVNRI